MKTNAWVSDDIWWYYLGGDGLMRKEIGTPDGYWVKEGGIWIEGGNG